jgi:hypothetical protein
VGPALFLGMMSSTWSPRDLGSKLKAWWAPLEGSNYTLNGSAVASWTDEVGGYVLSQSTAANQPAYSATGYGGRACAVFDGSNDYLALAPVPAGIPTGAAYSEAWISGSQSALVADTSTRFLLSIGGSSTATRLQVVRLVSGGVNQLRAVSANTYLSDNTADLSGAHVMRGVFASTVRADVDGAAGPASGAATHATGTTRLALGIAASLAGATWQGAVRQVVITDTLTAGEAALLLGYLNGNL